MSWLTAGQNIEADYTLAGWRDPRMDVHVGLVRTHLTRALAHLFPAVHDEIRESVDSRLREDGGESPLSR